MELSEGLREVRERMAEACRRAGREASEVTLVAVTKGQPPDVVRAAADLGLNLFGENKVQEAACKLPHCVSGPEWHLVGHLQRNKVRPALELFSVIHSVDSVRLLEQIERVAEEGGYRPEVLLEVNVSGESSKSGLSPAQAPEAIECALGCRSLTLTGLMTMAPFCPEPEMARPVFAKLREARDRWEKAFGIGLPNLSMGMSNDYRVAVEEGATWVRLGTVLFGRRPKWNPRGEAEERWEP